MSKCGIVFVHGIVGNSSVFDFLKPLLPESCEVKSVTLQGHGGDALDFSRTSMLRWKAQVKENVDELLVRCDTVVAVGHSMGCLLVIGEAAEGRISCLFLMNPPMRIRPRLRLLSNALKVMAGHTENDPVAMAARDAYGISIDYNPLHYYGWLSRYLELFREIRRTKALLPKLNCPVRVLLARGDEMVSLSSADAFRNLPDARILELPGSTHYYYPQPDRELMSREFQDLILPNI